MRGLLHRLTTLPGGLRVATATLPHVETVAVGVWIGAGTRHESEDAAGAAHLLEHMAFKGTERRDARRIAEEIESVGGSLDAHTSREYTAYYARLLAEDLPLALDLLADILQHSRLDEEELARERQVVLQEIAEVNDAPDDLVFDLFQEQAFPDQPLGRPVLGNRDSVAAMSREALCRFLRERYVMPRAIVAAAGKVEHEEVEALAESLFGGLAPDGRPSSPPARYRGGARLVEREFDQVHLVLGFPAPAYGDPDYFALHLLSNILGGGMASRLFQEVRERRGLAYSVFGFASCFSDAGLFGVYSSTEPEQSAELLFTLCDELRRFAEGPTAEELARAKKQLEASLLMSLESCGAVAEDLARQLLFFGRRLPVPEIVACIEAVTRDDLRRLAHGLLGATPTLAAIGPLSGLPDFARVRARLA